MKQSVKTNEADKMKVVRNHLIHVFDILAFLPLVLMLVCVFVISADAGNGYIANWSYTDSQTSTGNTYFGQYEIINDNPMFLMCYEHNGMYQLGEYIPEEKEVYNMAWVGNHTGDFGKGERKVIDKNGKVIRHDICPMVDPDGTAVDLRPFAYTVTPYDSLIVSSNLYVFDSLDSARAYYKYGDLSGVISAPSDYEYDHDFRKDDYDENIPVPELSDLTHHSFHVDNALPTRDIEIYIESTFYGVKHTTDVKSGNFFTCDNSFVFKTHRYNLINTDISYSDADIDIKEKFGVDTLGALVNDFKMWSTLYPNHYYLPDCADFDHHPDEDYNTEYKFYHTYNGALSSKNDDTRIRECKQASTTYYVRFCEYVPGSGYTWGKWKAYTYTPQGYGQRDDVTQGGVRPDPDTGKPVITDPETGKQDPDTGIIEPGNPGPELVWPDGSVADLVGGINNVLDVLKGIKSLFGEFPAFLAETFGFIPTYIWSIIGAGLTFMIIVAAIKALLSLK